MPQLPESLTLHTKGDQAVRIDIDGTEFPWHISAEDGVQLDIPSGPAGLARVTLTLLVSADRITVKAAQ